jgi:hypothetical protein
LHCHLIFEIIVRGDVLALVVHLPRVGYLHLFGELGQEILYLRLNLRLVPATIFSHRMCTRAGISDGCEYASGVLKRVSVTSALFSLISTCSLPASIFESSARRAIAIASRLKLCQERQRDMCNSSDLQSDPALLRALLQEVSMKKAVNLPDFHAQNDVFKRG